VPLESLGRVLLLVGLVIAGLGLLLVLGGRIPFLGNLPGDLRFGSDNVRIYVPIATSIVVSIVLTVLLNLIFGLFNRP
jgi:hypothetical protein